MNTSITLLILGCVTIAFGYPTHNGMFFYQTPSYYNTAQRYHPYQQSMFVHYNQPSYPSYPADNSRSAGSGSSVFAVGDTIAAGTYVKDNVQPPKPVTAENVPVHDETVANDDDVHAIAEAYPTYPEEAAYASAAPPRNQDVEQPEIQNQNIYSERENDLAPLEIVTTEEPLRTTTITSAAPTKSALPPKKKKVTVELAPVPEPKYNSEDDEEEDQDEVPFFYKPQKKKNGTRNQTPYSFFPLYFGDTSGGAVAVANAFSTGKGGATSHAIAYGTPSSKKGYSSKRIVQQ